MTIPGVGPVTSVRFVAALDEVRRFPDAHSVHAYLGLVPGEHSTATRQRRSGITEAGPSRVRWTLAQSAWVFRRFNKSEPLTLWCLEVEKRRGSKIAITALARRLAGASSCWGVVLLGRRLAGASSCWRDVCYVARRYTLRTVKASSSHHSITTLGAFSEI